MKKIKYAAVISYVGTDYCGWQKQKISHPPSIQLKVESALTQMTSEQVRVIASGRTDAGVHSIGQVIHFTLMSPRWTAAILARGLNGLLPMSIRVLKLVQVDEDFHAQRGAEKKQYSYYFQQGPSPQAHLIPYSWWISKTLDIGAMSQAGESLKGTHDFKPFQASGAKPGPTVRTIFELSVSREPIGFPMGLTSSADFYWVRVRVVGSGFLKQMVRGIAGTLLQIGEKRRPSEVMAQIIESGNRLDVGPTAPARALWLEKVWYPERYGLE